MGFLVFLGASLTVIGLAVLIYCIAVAARVRQSDSASKEVATRLQRLLPLNMAGLAVSALGLMLIVIGILL